MVTKRDRPTDDDRVNIEQSASGRWADRVLQKIQTQEDLIHKRLHSKHQLTAVARSRLEKEEVIKIHFR